MKRFRTKTQLDRPVLSRFKVWFLWVCRSRPVLGATNPQVFVRLDQGMNFLLCRMCLQIKKQTKNR